MKIKKLLMAILLIFLLPSIIGCSCWDDGDGNSNGNGSGNGYPDFSRAVFVEGEIQSPTESLDVTVVLNPDWTGSLTAIFKNTAKGTTYGWGASGTWEVVQSNPRKITYNFFNNLAGSPKLTGFVVLYRDKQAIINIINEKQLMGKWYQE